ncbi:MULTISPECIES: DoxX family protein [unclassified Nocardia]|uniref:DoxX family protein n=1 Tax=unclassified Nocardia TaxID=2637762 RepID=UPI001CE42B66|nr:MULTISPECIES: DoxX family protein [unclassified Nocardia]
MSTNTIQRATGATSELDKVSTDIGLLVLRVGFGGVLAAHGAQKLFGWFNGMGWQTTASVFDGMGYKPGKFFGTLAGLCEFTGGLLLVLGLVTPLAAAIVIGTMINAINVTWGPGLLGKGGWEEPLLFALAALTLAFTGPGKFSLDHGRLWHRQGFIWGAGALVLAVVTAALTLLVKS